MNIQDYKQELREDILTHAEEMVGYCGSFEDFRDSCWIDDGVTGNGSGSYTFNRNQAEENVKDLIFSDELLEMFKEFGYERVPLENGPEFIDVSIRCFLLDEVLNDIEGEVKEILKIQE